MSSQKFYEVLASVKAEKKSGKMYVNVKEGSAIRMGSFHLSEGEVIGIDYLSLSGVRALEKILSLGVDKIVFVPASPDPAARQAENILSITTILDMIQIHLAHQKDENTDSNVRSSIKSTPGSSFSQVSAANLHKAAEQALQSIYGPGISQQLDKIVRAYPPEANPLSFLKECEKKARLLVGEEKAHQLFGALYEQVK